MKLVLFAAVIFTCTSAFAIPQINYLFKTGDSKIICIDADLEADSFYKSFRFFIGKSKKSLIEIPVENVSRLRDGGTTHISLRDGGLFIFPSPINVQLKPTFNGVELSKLPISAGLEASCSDL